MTKKPWSKTIAMLGAICLMASALPAHALSITSPTASKGKYSSYVYVTWPSSSLGRKGYNVYRTPTAKFANATLLGRTSSLRWADRTAATGQKYWYWVEPRGYHLTKGQTAGAKQGGFRTVFIPKATVKATTSGVTLTWTASAGAKKGYYIYRGTSSSPSQATKILTINSGKTCKCIDGTGRPGRTYYYWIVVRGCNFQVYSSSKWAKGVRKLVVPALHASVIGSPSVGAPSIWLTWSSVNGATQYIVFRGGSWATRIKLGYTTKTYFEDLTFPPYTALKYYYWVCPLDIRDYYWYDTSKGVLVGI
jgi:hypothetical protein